MASTKVFQSNEALSFTLLTHCLYRCPPASQVNSSNGPALDKAFSGCFIEGLMLFASGSKSVKRRLIKGPA